MVRVGNNVITIESIIELVDELIWFKPVGIDLKRDIIIIYL